MSNGNVTRYVTDPRNSAPTQPNPTQPISITCGWSFSSNVETKTKTPVAHATALGFGAAR